MKDQQEPLFNGSFHYIKLLGDIIAIANGFLVNGDFDSYRNTLCAWYNEIIYRVEKKKQSFTAVELESLKSLYYMASSGNNMNRQKLEQFHRILNRATHVCKLRLTDIDSNMRGWMKE